jgi:GrpB-like predicted nucleotidyltransferase (UPF0157 family)
MQRYFKPMIYLSPYDSEWPNLFSIEKEKLCQSIGQYILEIEHIGSTAIPEIYAKPVIDIMIGVDKLDELNPEIIFQLEQQGYEYIKKYEDKMPFRRFFLKKIPKVYAPIISI